MKRIIGIIFGVLILGLSACQADGDGSIIDTAVDTAVRTFTEEATERASESLFNYIRRQWNTSQERQPKQGELAIQAGQNPLIADAQWSRFNFSGVEYYICSSVENLKGDLSQINNNPKWSIASFYGFETNTKSWCAVKIFQADNALGFVEDQLRQSYQSIESLTELQGNLLAVYRAHHADGRVAYIVISHTSDNMSYLWMEALSADANVALGMTSKIAGFNM